MKSIKFVKSIKIAKEKLMLKTGRILNNERGGAILTGLIFTAILVLATLAMKPDITNGFGALSTWFETSIVEKVKSALN